MHSDQDMSLYPSDDSTIDHDLQATDHEKSKLYDKALFLLKQEVQRLPQVVINSLISDISTLLVETLKMSSRRGMHQLN